MNKGNLVGVVYLDLSKAFDTIGHALLLNKLSAYSVGGKELQWFTSYLFNRTQVVALGNINSNLLWCATGLHFGAFTLYYFL
jgi:hypothetical protein